MAKNYRRRYESFDDLLENGLDGRVSRKTQHNTYLQVRDRDADDIIDTVALLLHETDVLLFDETGITYNTGGWRSKITKERMNEYGPLIIFQDKGEWWCSQPGSNYRENKDLHWLYFDGMKVDYKGNLLNPRNALEREVASLSKRYMKRKIDAWLTWVEGQLDAGKSLYSCLGDDSGCEAEGTEFLLYCIDNYFYDPIILFDGAERRGIPTQIGVEIRCGLRPSGEQFGEVDRSERAELRKTLRAGIQHELLQESVYVPYYENR